MNLTEMPPYDEPIKPSDDQIFKRVKEFYYSSICVMLDNYHAIVNELDFTLKEIFHSDMSIFAGEDAFSKWKLWREKIKEMPRYKNSKKQLRRDVKTALLIRNKYIHGALHYLNNEQFLSYSSALSYTYHRIPTLKL